MLETLFRRRKQLVAKTDMQNIVQKSTSLPDGYDLRWLNSEDLPSLHRRDDGDAFGSPLQYYETMLDDGALFPAVFFNAAPVAWKFCSVGHQNVWGWVRIDAGPRCAFLVAAYTVPDHRGMRLQTVINQSLAKTLAKQGVTHFGAVRDPANTSSESLFRFEGYQDVALLEALYLPFGFKLVRSGSRRWFGRFRRTRRFVYQLAV